MSDPLLPSAGSMKLDDRNNKQPIRIMSSPSIDNSSKNYPTSFREYLRSKEALELACYVIFLGLPAILLHFIPHEPYDRSIPFQALDDQGGDYVKNLTYDLKEGQETVPSTLHLLKLVFTIIL